MYLENDRKERKKSIFVIELPKDNNLVIQF